MSIILISGESNDEITKSRSSIIKSVSSLQQAQGSSQQLSASPNKAIEYSLPPE